MKALTKRVDQARLCFIKRHTGTSVLRIVSQPDLISVVHPFQHACNTINAIVADFAAEVNVPGLPCEGAKRFALNYRSLLLRLIARVVGIGGSLSLCVRE